MWQSCQVIILHANERLVLPASCRIRRLWTARPQAPSISERHGWLPMSREMRTHERPRRDHPGILGKDMTWCRPVVPTGYPSLFALSVACDSLLLPLPPRVVSVYDPSLPPRVVSVYNPSLPPRVVSVYDHLLPPWVVSVYDQSLSAIFGEAH